MGAELAIAVWSFAGGYCLAQYAASKREKAIWKKLSDLREEAARGRFLRQMQRRSTPEQAE